MTNRQIVSKLRELGHSVDVYIRKDGSIRITRIDQERFSHRLSQGNEAGRAILTASGYVESPSEEARRAVAQSQRTAARASRASGNTLRSQSASFQSEFKKLQREIRKINKRLQKQGKKPKFGISWKTISAGARATGISVEKQLARARDYFLATSQGIAPSQMVARLRERLVEAVDKYPELQYFINTIDHNENRLDIYETRKTIDWLYGYAKDIKQSETWQERLRAFAQAIHKE